MEKTTRSVKQKIIIMLMVIILLFVVVIGRIFWVQFVQGVELQEMAMDQWVRDLVVAPTRGSILDRNGNELAKTVTADTVLLRPGEIETAGNADKVADELSAILGIDRQEVYDKATQDKSEVWLERQITEEQYAQIELLNLSGVAFTVDAERHYVFGDFASQTLGYTNVDGEGQSGVEMIYDKYLAGEAGKITSETDKDGRPLADAQIEVVEPVEGNNVVLSIDYSIQSFLESALVDAVEVNNAVGASGIVMNPNTGEILAMSSKPSFDPNDPPRNDTELLGELSKNKTVTDTYELGSIMKTITLSAALEEGLVDESDTYTCHGSKVVNGESISCHEEDGHGTQTLADALQASCNVAFMEIGLEVGTEKMYEYFDLFGFNEQTGINFPYESGALMLNQMEVREQDLARISFGQAIAVTPIQFVSAFNSMVNGGTLYTPYYVKQITTTDNEVVEEFEPEVKSQTISQETGDRVLTMLHEAIDPGNNAYIPGYRVGGKTATAQKYEDGKIAEGKYITSFVGVAPADDPEIVVFIMVDEPQAVSQVYGSTVASPVAKLVMEDSLNYLNVPVKFEDGSEEKELVEVPNLVGMSSSEATRTLENLGLNAQVLGQGAVENQFPLEGAKTQKDSTVVLYTTGTGGE